MSSFPGSYGKVQNRGMSYTLPFLGLTFPVIGNIFICPYEGSLLILQDQGREQAEAYVPCTFTVERYKSS